MGTRDGAVCCGRDADSATVGTRTVLRSFRRPDTLTSAPRRRGEINSRDQYPRSTHEINTRDQYPRSIHEINIRDQYPRSISEMNNRDQYARSIPEINTRDQYLRSISEINTQDQYPRSICEINIRKAPAPPRLPQLCSQQPGGAVSRRAGQPLHA
jgi:hypothetical protein